MSKSDRSAPSRARTVAAPFRALHFDQWVGETYRETDGFTALVVLIGIGDLAVTPLRSTYVNVIGDEIDWEAMTRLLAGAGVAWDGVLLEPVSAPQGGPVPDAEARDALRLLERRVMEDRMTINHGHFFDRLGRRMMVEEAPPQ